jgi:hypothetical protein
VAEQADTIIDHIVELAEELEVDDPEQTGPCTDRSYVLDSSAFETTFGVTPTPLDAALEATLAWWRLQPVRSAA